jgi:hypothetical protein
MTDRNQILSSGLLIRQDFGDSVRFVFFETGYSEWGYATEGGTAFVVNFKGKPYGITARHVLKGFELPKLVITDKKIGTKKAGIRAVYYPSAPNTNTIDTDVLDVLLIEFGRDVQSDYFDDTAYVIDAGTVGTSHDAHRLVVAGCLKAQSEITETQIKPQFCRLEFLDNGATKGDPTLRHAVAEFANPGFDAITGLSGSPVYDLTADLLCGMVVRGGMNGSKCEIRYVDVYDIVKMLESVHSGRSDTNYIKIVAHKVR